MTAEQHLGLGSCECKECDYFRKHPQLRPSVEPLASKQELDMALAFARLELLELEYGKRTLTQCPGIENVAAAIRKAKSLPDETSEVSYEQCGWIPYHREKGADAAAFEEWEEDRHDLIEGWEWVPAYAAVRALKAVETPATKHQEWGLLIARKWHKHYMRVVRENGELRNRLNRLRIALPEGVSAKETYEALEWLRQVASNNLPGDQRHAANALLAWHKAADGPILPEKASGLHDDRCATRKGYPCNCPSAALKTNERPSSATDVDACPACKGTGQFDSRGTYCAPCNGTGKRSQVPRPAAQPAKRTHIELSPAEIQSGLDRVRWAEGLIRQLPETHDGRNSWLLNYGTKPTESEPV